MEKDPKTIMITWEQVTLKDKEFVPQLSKPVKTVLLQHYLIVFNYQNSFCNQIFAFDLKEKQWLKIEQTGEVLDLKQEASVCLYGNNTIVALGTSRDGKEDLLSFLTVYKGPDGMEISHKLTGLQERLLKSHHSASIIGDNMFIFGGFTKGGAVQDLSVINLETLKITTRCACSGQIPGCFSGSSSISRDKKIYIYGGLSGNNQNLFLYVLNTKKMRWKMIQPSETQQQSTFQIHEENLYFYGGKNGVLSNYLYVYNMNEGFRYEIARKGSIPPQTDGAFSTIFEGKMFVFDTNPEQIYCFNLDIKPVKGFLTEVNLSEALNLEENNKDLETLEEIPKLLEENNAHDITFKVQNKEFPAHKNIMSLRSTFFSNMFSSEMQEAHSKEINLSEEISPEAFESFLEYVYKGTLPSRDDILKELILYSEKIVLKKLRVHCERALAKEITKENVVELYELSMVSKAHDLKDATLQFMGNHLSYFAKQLVSLRGQPLGTEI